MRNMISFVTMQKLEPPNDISSKPLPPKNICPKTKNSKNIQKSPQNRAIFVSGGIGGRPLVMVFLSACPRGGKLKKYCRVLSLFFHNFFLQNTEFSAQSLVTFLSKFALFATEQWRSCTLSTGAPPT
jgi:hypothetical protein